LFKQLDKAVYHNQNTLTSLTSIVKDYVLKIQNKFVNTVLKLEWITTQREVDTAIRNLEFTVTHLEVRFQELARAIENFQQGNFPLSLISFDHLHAILNNVTLTLPAGHELLSPHRSSIPWNISPVEVVMLGDTICLC